MKRRRRARNKFKWGTLFCAVLYVFLFLTVTTPIVLLYGPYENTRKVLISTVLATRHRYLLTDFISQEKLDEFLDTQETSASVDSEVTQDFNKINIEETTGNDITKYNIHTSRYDGYILEIKNPKKIKVAMTKYLHRLGQKTSEMAEEHNAVAAINGGSFVDESSDGVKFAGTGGEPGGFVISGGKVIYPETGYDEHKEENVIAFTKNGTLIVGDHTLAELKKYNVQEAMCFRKPNLIINGVRQVKSKIVEGFNPRTAVGQKKDGTVLFLVIDGRKIFSPGADLYDVQEIMMEKGAVNAGALDGGYSTTMYYKGNVVNSPNAWDGERTVATAFYVSQ